MQIFQVKYKMKKTNKDKLNFVIISPIIFLTIELIARMYNWYEVIPIYDLLSHILFGVTFYSLYWYKFKRDKYVLNQAYTSYTIIALLWEFLEIIGDTIFVNSSALRDIFFFDGLTDILIGFIGIYLAKKYLK